MKGKLNEKQKMFCKEYIKDLNGKQAAIRAGYSEKTARNIAANLLTKINVQELIEKLKAKRSKKTEIDAEWLLKRLVDIADADFFEILEEIEGATVHFKSISDVPKHLRKVVASVESTQNGLKVKFHDKMKAMEMIAKHISFYGNSLLSDEDIKEINIKIKRGG